MTDFETRKTQGVSECETRKSKGSCRVRHYYVGITILHFLDNR